MEPAKRRKQRRQQGGKGMQDQNCAAPDHVRARDQDGHRQADAKRQSEDSGSDDKRAGQQAPQRRIGDQAEIDAASARRQPDERPQQRKNRSEEHTSELQSLMRISYAVFCLKKKKTQKN